MKKAGLLVALMLCVGAAYGSMDDKLYSIAVVSTATNSSSLVLRGELEAVHIDVPTGKTGTVTVATAQDTLLTKAGIAADVVYYPRVATHTTAAAAATFVGGTNNVANTWYTKPVMAGAVTVTVIGQAAGTNTFNVRLIYKK